MRFPIIMFFLLFTVSFIPLCPFADTIVLYDGTRVEGRILQLTPKIITIQTSNLAITFNKDKIQEVKKESEESRNLAELNLPEKTTFEAAEELYHDGKVFQALPFYEEILKKDPNNAEVLKRLDDIRQRVSDNMQANALLSIHPISESDIILLVAGRKISVSASPRRPAPSPGQNPSSEEDAQNPFSLPSSLTLEPVRNVSPSPRSTGEGLSLFQPDTSGQTSASSPANPFQIPLEDKGDTQARTSEISHTLAPLPPLTLNRPAPSDQSLPASPFTDAEQTPGPSSGVSQTISSKAPLLDFQTASLPPMSFTPEPTKPPFLIVQAQTQASSQQPPSQNDTKPPTLATPPAETPSTAPAALIPKEEFRGVWISRFEWPDRDPARCKKIILRYLDEIAASNFNAVFFQVRGQGDVLYPSPYEPWSPLIGGKDPGFDPLQFALEEAHARKLEFHAYINAYPVWQGQYPPPHSTPEHPYWLYCQPDSNPQLVCMDKSGKIMELDKAKYDSYMYFSPGIPAVSAYIRKITMDIVKRYDVDGIHYDRIRYPGPEFSHDEVSKSRFQGEGNPGGLPWLDWQCDQITRFLNDVYGEVASVKPQVKISISGWGIYNRDRYQGYSTFSSGYHQYYQDTFAWMRKGVIDALCPMIYWDIENPKPNYDELAKDFIDNASGRHVYCANWVSQNNMPHAELRDQVNLTRELKGQGNVAFSIEGLEMRQLFAYYKKNIYPQPVAPTDMPWKKNFNNSGILLGKVSRKQNGEPVTDAQINITGRQETWLSSADGFFAILYVTPGTDFQIAVTKSGLGKYTSNMMQIQAGEVKHIEIPLGE